MKNSIIRKYNRVTDSRCIAFYIMIIAYSIEARQKIKLLHDYHFVNGQHKYH